MKVKNRILSVITAIMCAAGMCGINVNAEDAVLMGDASGNGVVDEEDVRFIIYYCTGPYTIDEAASDYNGDGTIDIYDACDLYGDIVGAKPSGEELLDNPVVSIGDFYIRADERVETSVKIKNFNARVAIFKVESETNQGLSGGDIGEKGFLMFNGKQVIILNPANELIEGPVASASFSLTPNYHTAETYEIAITPIEFGNSSNEKCTSATAENGSVNIIESITDVFEKGDVDMNKEINLYDAIAIAKKIMGTTFFNDDQKELADCHEDGVIDLYDVIEVAKMLLS